MNGWQLVSMVGLALAFVSACGYSPTCSQNMDKVYMLGATIIGGVFALAQGAKKEPQ